MQVLIELPADVGGTGQLCNQIVAFGETASGTIFADFNGDGSPAEQAEACFGINDVPIELMRFSVE